jgi:hypothetical protein
VVLGVLLADNSRLATSSNARRYDRITKPLQQIVSRALLQGFTAVADTDYRLASLNATVFGVSARLRRTMRIQNRGLAVRLRNVKLQYLNLIELIALHSVVLHGQTPLVLT